MSYSIKDYPEIKKINEKGFVLYAYTSSVKTEDDYLLMLGMIFTCFARKGSWSLSPEQEPGLIFDRKRGKTPFLDVLWDYPIISHFTGTDFCSVHNFKRTGFENILKAMNKQGIIQCIMPRVITVTPTTANTYYNNFVKRDVDRNLILEPIAM